MPIKLIRTPDDPHRLVQAVYLPERAAGRPNPRRPLGHPRDGSLQPVAKPERQFVVGLDLGQAGDWTALAAVERLASGYAVPMLTRTRGRPYPEIVGRVAELMTAPPLVGTSRLVVDATGVGRPVIDMLRMAELEPVAVTITAGSKVAGGRHVLRAPKRDVVTALLVLLQAGLIKISAELPLAPVLADELANMRVRITQGGHDQYGVWREGQHDDLVLAVALAVWYAERRARRGGLAVTTLGPPASAAAPPDREKG